MPTPAPGADPHWTANGGTPIVVAQGESAAVLATRYGVPTDALVKSNGFTSAAQVQPGVRLIVPVYRAVATAKSAPITPPSAPSTVAAAAATTKPVVMTKAEKRLQQQEELAAAREKAAATAAKAAEEKRLRVEAEREAKTRKQAEAKMLRQADAKTSAGKVAAVETPAPAPAPAAKLSPAEAKVAANVDHTPTAAIPPDAATKPIPPEEGPEFRWPARGRVIQGFTSGGNDGINIAVPEGTQVKAAESGEVAYAGSELKGYGNMVLIRHAGGYVTAYAHNGALEVRKGDKVKRGQTIAKSGQTGNVSSPQLHFELRKGQTPIDPTRYLAGL
jgi:murein DD-endopeptidase MepM/ murein hydrolase activator NlpD